MATLKTALTGNDTYPGLTQAKSDLVSGMTTIGEEGQKSLSADSNIKTKLDELKTDGSLTEDEYNYLIGELAKTQSSTGKVLDTVTDGGKLKSAAAGVTYAETVTAGVLQGDGSEKNPGLSSVSGQLSAGVKEMATQIGAATSETGELSVGLKTLVDGSSELAAGETQLSAGASELAAGMDQLYSKSGLLISGIGQLDAGARKLNDGMSQFYKEGIGKIVSLYNSKLKGMVNNAGKMVAAGKAYNTFTQVPDGMDGSVKFVYRTKVAD